MRTSQPPAANSTTTGSTATGTAGGLGRTALGNAAGQRLPVAPRERKPALAALAVLLILGGALTSAYLVIASGERVSAIKIVQPVAAGQPIPAAALAEVQIGDTGIKYVRWSERDEVAGAYAAVPLVAGSLLTNEMTSRTDEARRGRLVVGLALKPGQYPAGQLKPGTRVSLYAVGGQGVTGIRPGTTLSADAIVVEIAKSGGDGVRSDQTLVSVSVPPEQAPQVTQAASAGQIAVALVPQGTTVPPGQSRSDRTTGQPPTGQQPPQSPASGGTNGTGGTNGGTGARTTPGGGG